MKVPSWLKLKHVVCTLLSMAINISSKQQDIFHNHFAVHLKGGQGHAKTVAEKHGFVNLGQIGDLKDHYLFYHHRVHKRSTSISLSHHQLLQDEPNVVWFQQQKQLRRTKRSSTHEPTDPLYKKQWFLNHGAVDGSDMNVAAAWKKGFTGKGVTVTILDDGIQHDHPDLIQNYDPRASTDINDNDDDPMPQDNGDNKHGTRCAGEVSAVAYNGYCGVGVAYNASIGGVRMLDGMVNDAVEARALSLNPQHIDIYSASWGPEDDGKTVDGPGPLAQKAFVNGITKGRNGLGSIFVWASGNGGRKSDNCNCDGYTNSPFTLSISSATQGGRKPWYLEECSSTLASTYSSGTPSHDASIVTVDQDKRLRQDKICTSAHTGTSASAPIAAGLCALALEANRKLTWRDMQHIVLLTANPEPLLHEPGWSTNAVGKQFSYKFGYGLMDGAAMVDLAKKWPGIGPRLVCETAKISPNLKISPGSVVRSVIATRGCAGTSNEVQYLEHVQCIVSLKHAPRGALHLVLISPSGTRSSILFPRPGDAYKDMFNEWPFLSVHFWGESAKGNWTLEIDQSTKMKSKGGILKKWQLLFYGTYSLPKEAEAMYLKQSQISTTIHPGQNRHHSFNFSFGDYTSNDASLKAIHCKEGSSQKCDCKEHYYLGADKICHPCHRSCKSCYGPSYRQCLTCTKPLKYYYVRDKSQCMELCPDGFLKDKNETDLLSCQKCPSNCKICPTINKCAKCEDHLVVHQGKCLTSCPYGYFKSKESGSCQKCNPMCETCVGPRPSQCSKCTKDYYYFQRSCVNSCPKGFVAKLGECVPCPQGCDECSQDLKCLECADLWTFVNSSCVLKKSQECGNNSYFNEEVGACRQCHKTCKSCSNGKDHGCLTCPDNHHLHIDSCTDVCPEDTYLSAGLKECRHCRHACKTCSSHNTCNTCHQGYYLLKNKLNQSAECVDSCGVGMYPDYQGVCQPCDDSCKTCTGPGACVSCRPSKLLSDGKCLNKCSEGYFLDLVNQSGVRCMKCHPSCATCSGPTHLQCQSCPKGLWYLEETQTCTSCKAGQYFGNGSCLECHPSCKTCSGPKFDQCTSCASINTKGPLMLDSWNGTCVACCPLKEENTSVRFCCVCDGLKCTQPSALATLVQPTNHKRQSNFMEEPSFNRYNTLFAVVLILVLAFLAFVGLRCRPCKVALVAGRRPKILRSKFSLNGGSGSNGGVHRNGDYRQLPLTSFEVVGQSASNGGSVLFDSETETEEELEHQRLIHSKENGVNSNSNHVTI